MLKEFLVKLGFQTDEKSLKRFTGGVEAATKGVTNLVAAIQGAALTISIGVARFASGMEKMYFAASKSGASEGKLRAFSKTVENLTGNGEDAASSIQGLARALRSNPGNFGVLAALGVDARDANGKLRDTADIMADLGVALSQRSYPVAKQYADMLGVGEDTLMAMMSPDFAHHLAEQQKLIKGYEDAAKASHEFMKVLRELMTRLEVVGVTIGNALLKTLGPQMAEVATWFERNADVIAASVGSLGSAILKAGEIILPVLKKIAEGYRLIFEYGRKVYDLLPEGLKEKAIGAMEWMFGSTDPADVAARKDAATGGAAPGAPQKKTGGAGAGGKKMDAMAFFQRMGWTRDQAAGIVANLQHESNMDPRAVGDGGKAYGIAQWHPDRQRNFEKWSGKSMRDSSLEEQLAFVNFELTQGAERKAGALLRAAENATQAGEIVSREYERPQRKDYEAAKRGQTAVTIAQTTTIQVAGGDPAATGRAVASEQGRVNQTLVRNLQTAAN
ncbi:MAG: phage tail tip lysozyme [Hydrogenophaga sp.]|uniref:phage tail tip lysozyme n=1 Tax=Hydrogenophaga sp. TaxID=1904254 RepID=UPI0027332E1A|nr:phage tail tip lysozyme [Hydrogenophaga sp.]MDP3351810.1 phage tail tip lysozyme [Hydrogenophaga sp.]